MTRPACRCRVQTALLLFCLACSTVSLAKEAHAYTQVGHNISIGPGEEVNELTCFGCSIRIRGHVAGDVTTFGGSVVIEDQAEVGGDVTTFAGDITLDRTASVGGDVAVFGGQLRRESQARVSGDVTTMGGRGWVVLILFAPLMMLGLFIALVVWIIQRLRRPAVPVAVA
jgi:cytoskeletal protein CcmA (bactofilin family)